MTGSDQPGGSAGGSDGRTSLTRRSMLAATAGTGLTALAGCLGGGGEQVTIGVLLPFSGQFASIGEQFQRGIDLAIEEDLEGEIDGREVELLQRDSQFDPNTGVDVVREYLQSDDVDFIVGPVGSAVAGAIKPVIHQDGSATWVNINAASKTLITEDCSPYHVRTSYNSYMLGYPMGEWVYENRGQTAAVGYMDYSFGQQTRADFVAGFEEAGGEIVEEIPTPLDTDDHAPIVQQFANSGADVAFTVYTGAQAVGYLQAADEFGLQDEMAMVGFGLVEWETHDAAGEAMVGAEGSFYYSPFRDIEANNEYFELYQSVYDDIPFGQDAFAYDGIKLIDDAVSEVGSTAPEEVIPFMRGYETDDSPRGTFRIDEQTQDAISDVLVLRAEGPEREDLQIIDVFEAYESPNYGCDLRDTLE